MYFRKNWQNLNGFEAKESLSKKVDNLSSAYNDIQDRLYEIDKSWKNNLVVYGIPCSENMDEDPLVTEEKVNIQRIFLLVSHSGLSCFEGVYSRFASNFVW